MLIPHQFIYRGNLAAIGDFSSQFYCEALASGNIVAVYFEADSVSSFTDSWYFGLKKNGVDVLTGTNRPQLLASDLQVEKTGLSIPVTFRDKLSPTIDARGTGTIDGPINVIIVVDDGVDPSDIAGSVHSAAAKTTPVDADEVGIVDSAASYILKKLTWANLKATLKTYFDTLYVALTGAQTIAGVKTFSSSPVVPTPSGSTDAANKGYVDSVVGGGGYTDEQAQDAIGAMIDGSLNYVDATPLLQRAALTGDVTASAGSNATTIANAAVTLAKMANLAANSILGNNTGSAATPIALTAAQAGALLQGDGLTDAQVGFRNVPQNSQSAAYTCVASDAGKHILHPASDANARTFTIPANSSVAFPVGTAITFINETSQVVTIAITTDTLTLANSTTTGSRSLAQNGIATAIKVTSTKWIISGSGIS